MQNRLLKSRKLLIITVLMVLVVLGCMLTAAADDLTWNLLTDEGYNIRDAHNAYTLETEDDGTPYMINSRRWHGALYIDDTQNILGSYSTFSLEGDFYFSSFPSGTRTEAGIERTPKEYPLSFLCWLYNDLENPTSTVAFNALRIDDEGYLYTDMGAKNKTDVQLETGKWYNIRCIFSPRNGACEIFINGKKALDYSFTRFDVTKHISYSVRYLDGFYSFDVKMKNLIVKTDSNQKLTLRREEAAEFTGYQTAKPVGNVFDARLLLGLNDCGYNRVGYEIIKIARDEDWNVISEVLSERSKVVYTTLKDAAGKTYAVKDQLGYDYAAALVIEDLPAKEDFELVVRPYVLGMDGIRRYGISGSYLFSGETDAEGYPLLVKKVEGQAVTVPASADTYVYNNLNTKHTNYGSAGELFVRNVGDENTSLYRAVYYKFTLSAEAVKALDSATSAKLRVYIRATESNSSRKRYDMIVNATDTGWDEMELTFSNSAQLAAPQEEIYYGPYATASYTDIEILPYLREQYVEEDGTMEVSFRFMNEGHEDALLTYFNSRETFYVPYIEITNSLYNINLNPEKNFNEGYEPWGYAESIVNEWFDDLRDKVYLKDENGDLVYHDEYGDFAPEGYDATEATGDFTREFVWKNGTIWTKKAEGGYMELENAFSANRFGRTLSTLGTGTANAFLSSAYAETVSEYDIYGGISNSSIYGKATGFFHTEKIGDRTYIIDPLGNPFFATGVNTFCYGDSFEQPKYSEEKYISRDKYFSEISRDLRDMGINVTWVSPDNDDILKVENGLSVVVSLKGVGAYMGEIGRAQVSEGVYPYGNTINVFDPDFKKTTFEKNAALITEGGYANMPNVFGYIADNELPAHATLLERYLTLDTAEPTNAFSYATAWAWLGRRLGTAFPMLEAYQNSPEKEAINSEFISFMYARAYKVIGDSAKAVDPNHMYMGSRVHGVCITNEGYLRAAGHFLDILTINLYGGLNPDAQTISNFYKYSGKPFIVTEFFAKGMDAIDANGYKLANSTGAGILVHTQQDRADYYEHYALTMLESKSCVGWTWYRFRDNDQSLYRKVGTENTMIMLHVEYGENPVANTFMDENGNILTKDQVGDYERIYRGEAIASNQNVNKGIYNNDFSSVVTVYTYDASGKLVDSASYKVKDPASATLASGDTVKTLDGTESLTIGRKELGGGAYSETVLTVFAGKYVALANSMRAISDHLMGLIEYFDE